MIGIIAAMPIEAEELIAHIEQPAAKTISGRTFTGGKIHGKDVVVCLCGIGKVNAAVCTEALILNYAPDIVINTGVGGALDKTLRLTDVVCASYAVQHDMDTSALGDPVGFVSTVNRLEFPLDEDINAGLVQAMTDLGIRAIRAPIATGDRFIYKPEDKQYIRDTFGCAVCEMEGCAIAQACLLNGTPCAILRSISDGVDDSDSSGARMTYSEFAEMAAHRSAKVLLRFIENY